jgi:hypothetical protein
MSNMALYVIIFILLGVSWLSKKMENDPEFILRLMKKTNEMESKIEAIDQKKQKRKKERTEEESKIDEQWKVLLDAIVKGNEEEITKEREKHEKMVIEHFGKASSLVLSIANFLLFVTKRKVQKKIKK